MSTVIQRVLNERKRQNEKWGIQDHNTVEWIAIITEEIGEASQEAVDFHFRNPVKGTPISIPSLATQSVRLQNLKTELIQTAAVAIQAVESIERQERSLLEWEDPAKC